MNINQIFEQLRQLNITLRVADDGLNLVVASKPGVMTDDLREAIRANKLDLIEASCHHVVIYEREQLYDQLPKCYRVLLDGKIMALYRSQQELGDHVFRAVMAKHNFKNTDNLVSVAVALGGQVVTVYEDCVAVQGSDDEIPF